MASLDLELIRPVQGKTKLGESPVWDTATNAVWWVDIDGLKLLRTDLESGATEAWNTPEHPGFVVLTGPDRAAVGMETGIFAFDRAAPAFERIVGFEGKGQRFNDATVDPAGRLWASTMALDPEPGRAAIHLVTGGTVLETVIPGLTIPNGLAVDLERGRLFYSDSHRDSQSIWVRPVRSDAAILGDATLFATTTALRGRPDGAAMDERGFYWIAGVDGSELYVFDPDGQLHDVVVLPFPAPTKLCFYGAEGRNIAITSKGIGEDGGFLALAELPEPSVRGGVQPCWAVAGRS